MLHSTYRLATVAATLLLVGCPDNLTPQPLEPYVGSPAQLECVPNLDGRIDRAEIGAAFGVELSYLINPANTERIVDPFGELTSDGTREWDFGEDRVDDQVLTVVPEALGTQWYAPSFPSADLVLPADAAGTTVGLYRLTDEALLLLGSASVEENPSEGQTLLVYDEPVALQQYPIQQGQTFTSVGTIQNGTLLGLPFAGTHTYEVKVDGSGVVLVPQLTFTQALRVKTTFTVEPVFGGSTVLRQTGFYFECFGEVVRLESQLNEPDEDFTTAREVRRIGQGL